MKFVFIKITKQALPIGKIFWSKKKEKIIWTLNSLSEYFLSLRDFII